MRISKVVVSKMFNHILMFFSFLLVSLFCFCESYKILVVFGFPGKSHSILGNELVKLLLKDGHEVTFLSAPGNYRGQRENLSLIDLSDIDTLRTDNIYTIENMLNKFKNINISNKRKIRSANRMLTYWNRTIHHSKVQEMLMDTSLQFNAVIVEWLYSELGSGFAAVYQCPLIWFSSMEPDWSVLSLIDEVPNPAYSIDFATDLVPPFTFLQRIEQLWALIYTYFHLKCRIHPQSEESYDKAFSLAANKRGIKLPSLQEIKFNASLMLGNSNAILTGLIKVPQNYKHIGGFHIDDNAEQLPDNLQKILNDAKHGFIYFSMGTMIKSWQAQLKIDLLHMFGTLNYTVLWKLDEDQPNLPPNVFTVKWAPQQSVFAHPNIKLFITHGGLLSMTEAVHFAVPLIGIPGFADQQLNVQKASQHGFCVRVDLSYNLAANLKLGIEEILGNPTYKHAVNQLSRIYHDRIVSPREEISFWVRHVIESNNAEYLRSPALMVPWYQKLYLDLALVILFILIVILKSSQMVLVRFCRKSNNKKLKLK